MCNHTPQFVVREVFEKRGDTYEEHSDTLSRHSVILIDDANARPANDGP
jgi:hypothetical protein